MKYYAIIGFLGLISMPGTLFAQVAARPVAKAKSVCSSNARIAIAPPLTADTELGDALVEVVVKELIRRNSLVCNDSNFVNQDKSRKSFDLIGMTSYFTLTPDRIYPSQIEYLVESLNASHIAFVVPNKKKNLIHVDIRPIQNSETLAASVLEFDLHYDESTQFLPKTPKIVRLLALLTPNTVTLGSGDTTVSMNIEEPYSIASQTNKGIAPPIISSISFDKIEHYRTYRTFDYGGSFFPSTFLFAINQDTIAERPDLLLDDPRRSKTFHVEAYGGCVTAMLQGSLHTPLGTTYSGFGAGPCLLQKRMEQKDPIFYGTGATRIIMGHRAFMSEKWYVYFDVDILSFMGSPLYKSEYASSNSVTRASIGVGYYLADLEHTYTSLWLK